MMNLDTPNKKILALHLLVFTDHVDANGSLVTRTSYPKKIYGGVMSLLRRIREDVAILTANNGEVSLKNYSRDEHGDPLGEVYSSSDLPLSSAEHDALAWAWNDIEEIKVTDEITFNYFSENLND